MNGAVINVRVDSQTKVQAQNVAEELGFSLSGVIHAFLKQLIRTQAVSFAVSEEQSDYLIKTLKESDKDIKAGQVSPLFTNVTGAIKWLNTKKKRYGN